MALFSRSLLGNERFPPLTGLRAVAAFIVFFHHLQLHTRNNWLTGLQYTFYFGVTIFFVLSGFLITWHYYKDLNFSGKWFLDYLIKRFARIYPVYFLVLTVVILLQHNYDKIFLLQNYTLTHNLFFLFKSHGMAIKPSWTLTVEECFYLLAPLIFWLIRKSNIYIPLSLTLLIAGILLLTYGDGSIENTVFVVIWLTFFGNALAFYAGIFLALKMRKKEPLAFEERKGIKFTAIGIAGIIIADAVLDVGHHQPVPQTFLWRIVGNIILLPFPVAVLLYGLIKERTVVSRVLSGNLFRLFGRSSYVFYLIHLPVIDYIGKPYIYPHFIHSGYDIYVLSTFLITLTISMLLYKFFEHPMNNWIKRLVKTDRNIAVKPSF